MQCVACACAERPLEPDGTVGRRSSAMRSAAQHSLADMPTSQPAVVTCYTANNQQQGAVHLERCRAVGLLWDSLARFQWLHPTVAGAGHHRSVHGEHSVYWQGLIAGRTRGYSAVLCSAVQCSAAQCVAQYGAVQCSAVRRSAVQCSAVQCSAVQCSAVRRSV